MNPKMMSKMMKKKMEICEEMAEAFVNNSKKEEKDVGENQMNKDERNGGEMKMNKLDNLKNEYENLPKKQKLEFVKLIMPEIAEIMQENPEEMEEMMDLFQEIMKDNMNMGSMMKMMGMMNN